VTQVIDYGLIHKATKMADGSIRAYVRTAAANRKMKYLNSDGSIRLESITREQLFDKDSTDTMKVQVITYNHPPEDVTPDNYNKYSAGSTGNIIAFDGDFLGVVASIRSRDAIDAFESGIREFSPGYTRNVRRVTDSEFLQLDRRYNHAALVDRARGGRDIRAKDSNIDAIVFDSSQIDDDLIQLFGITTDQQELAIDRLLVHGELSPKSLDLTTALTTKDTMALTTITVGGKALQVDSASADDASKLSANYDSIEKKALKAEKLLQQLTDAEMEIVALKAQNAQQLKDSEGQEGAVAKALADVAIAKTQSANFKAKGIVTDAAEKLLDKYDINGYKSAIVKATSKSFDPVADADEVDIRYKQIVDSFSAQFFPEIMLEPLNRTMSKASGSLESAKRGVRNGTMNGLPSDSDWE
jgi:hypothetical protein